METLNDSGLNVAFLSNKIVGLLPAKIEQLMTTFMGLLKVIPPKNIVDISKRRDSNP
jgi:hypothetical protein